MMRSTNRPLSQYALCKCTQEQLTVAAGLFCRIWNKIFIQKYQDLGFYILDNTRQRNVSQNFGTNCHLNKFLKFLDFMCTACKFSMISHHTLFPQRDKQRYRQLYIGVGILNTLTKCQNIYIYIIYIVTRSRNGTKSHMLSSTASDNTGRAF